MANFLLPKTDLSFWGIAVEILFSNINFSVLFWHPLIINNIQKYIIRLYFELKININTHLIFRYHN